MMEPKRIVVMGALLLLIVSTLPASGSGPGPDGHPSLMPELDPEAAFPRFTTEDLARHGFPDHKHLYFWPDWQPLVDEQGREYGIGSMCSGIASKDRPDLGVEPGRITLGRYSLEFREDAAPCFVAPYLGLCEMAEMDLERILDLVPEGELRIVSPDDIPAYTALTGNGAWRMFRLEGDTCQVQPVGILARRTLIGHAAWDMVARWTLDRTVGGDLPLWLRDGTASWFAELGVHLVNYMARPRLLGEPILLDPAEVELRLAAAPLEDQGRDRLEFRRARYNAFLMVWRLVEQHGGVQPLRTFLQAVRDGGDADEVGRLVYGMDLAALAAELDPRKHGEPLGGATDQRNPSSQP